MFNDSLLNKWTSVHHLNLIPDDGRDENFKATTTTIFCLDLNPMNRVFFHLRISLNWGQSLRSIKRTFVIYRAVYWWRTSLFHNSQRLWWSSTCLDDRIFQFGFNKTVIEASAGGFIRLHTHWRGRHRLSYSLQSGSEVKTVLQTESMGIKLFTQYHYSLLVTG